MQSVCACVNIHQNAVVRHGMYSRMILIFRLRCDEIGIRACMLASADLISNFPWVIFPSVQDPQWPYRHQLETSRRRIGMFSTRKGFVKRIDKIKVMKTLESNRNQYLRVHLGGQANTFTTLFVCLALNHVRRSLINVDKIKNCYLMFVFLS